MQFADPEYLWLLLVIAPATAWYVFHLRKAKPTLSISSTQAFAHRGMPLRAMLRHTLFVLRMLAVACLVIILARPQLNDNWQTSSTEGTDIVMAMDVSTSMLARDLKPNRMEAAKKMATQFVDKRTDDNIGVVIFSGESLTGMPMTIDHNAINNYIQSLHEGMLADGTAIGDGIATALNRISRGKAKSKSIILLTDGSNNTGLVAPLHAAEIAKNKKVKIYTIGIGTNGMAMAPSYMDAFGRIQYAQEKVVIDEATLKEIATSTGGKYFRATDNKSLENIFAEIDRLEKTKMDVRHFSHTEDDYMMWAWLLIGLVALELTLRYTVFRSIP